MRKLGLLALFALFVCAPAFGQSFEICPVNQFFAAPATGASGPLACRYMAAGDIRIGTLGYSDTNILGYAQASANSYTQFIIQNTNSGAVASADFVASNNLSTATTYYGDFGMNSSGFTGSGAFNTPNMVYVQATSGDLALGTSTANAIHFVINGGATDAGGVGTSSTWGLGTSPLTTTMLALPAGSTTVSPLNIPQGSAPSSPNNGDIWTTASGVFARIAGSTVGPFGAGGGSGTVTNTAGSLTLNSVMVGNGVNDSRVTPTAYGFASTARSSGVAPYVNIAIPADTGITASTEGAGFTTTTATRTWATTGTVALQRENFWAGPTYASASASQTFTDVFTGYMTPPIQGTNAIFTREHTFGIVDSTSAASAVTGGFVVATTLGTAATSVGIGGGNVNAGGAITSGGALTAGTTLTATGGAASLQTTSIAGAAATTALTLTQTARTSGVLPYIKYTIPTDTAQTASTESPGIQGVTATRTWATTGTIALQREIFFPGPTYASASASQTFTDVFNMYLTPPVQGTNAIFTREHTFGIVDSTSASSSITGGLVVATTLGTAATSCGIGGGNINCGGTGTFGGAVAGTTYTGTSFSGTGAVTAFNATAIPSGGTAGDGFLFSSTSNYGVFMGTAAPTLSAAEGSLYLRNDTGHTYYNNNGTTGWTDLTAGSGIGTVGDTSTSPAFSGTNGTTLTGTNAAGLTLTAASGGTAAAVNVTGGTATTSANAGGAVNITGGTPGATGVGGGLNLTSGAGGSSSNSSGAINITSGASTSGATGVVTIASGVPGNASAQPSGAVTIGSGNTGTGASGPPGTTTIQAGNSNSATQGGGAIAITSGNGNTTGSDGAITITSGGHANASSASGNITLATGANTSFATGTITLKTGAGSSLANAGEVIIAPAGNNQLVMTAATTPTNAFTGTLTVSAIQSSAAAQTGYLCYNTSGGTITYDSAGTCLVSRLEYKDIKGMIADALPTVMRLQPIWGAYKHEAPFKDFETHPMFIAQQVDAVDKRLTSHNDDGEVRGVRYQEMTALLTAAVQEQQREIAELRAEVRALKRHAMQVSAPSAVQAATVYH